MSTMTEEKSTQPPSQLPKLYKIVHESMHHYNFKYREGLNDDSANFDTTTECGKGLHFATARNIWRYFKFGTLVADVTIPEDAQVVHYADKSKANKIIISNLRPWKTCPILWEDEEFCRGIKENVRDYRDLIRNTNVLKDMIKTDGTVLRRLKPEDRTEDVCLNAVQNNGMALEFVPTQTEPIVKTAVKNNPSALQFVKNQIEEVCDLAIRNYPLALQFVRNKTPGLIAEAVRRNGMALEFVEPDQQTEEVCLKAIKSTYHAFQFIRKHTAKICKELVLMYPKEFSKIPEEFVTPELCILARLGQDGEFIRNVSNPTDEMYRVAIRNKPWTIQYVEKQTEELCLLAVRRCGLVLKYVHCKTPAVIAAALLNTKSAIQYAGDEYYSDFSDGTKKSSKPASSSADDIYSKFGYVLGAGIVGITIMLHIFRK